MSKSTAVSKSVKPTNENLPKLGKYGITAAMLYKLGMEKEPTIDNWATRPNVPRVMRAGFTVPTSNGPVPVYYIRDLSGKFFPMHEGHKSLVFIPALEFTSAAHDASAIQTAPTLHVRADDETGLEQVAAWLQSVLKWAEKNEVTYLPPSDSYCGSQLSRDIRERIRDGKWKRHAAPLEIAQEAAETTSPKAAKAAKKATKKKATENLKEAAKEA